MLRKTSELLFCWVLLELPVLGANLSPARRLCVPPAGRESVSAEAGVGSGVRPPAFQCSNHCARGVTQTVSPPVPQFLNVFREDNDS